MNCKCTVHPFFVLRNSVDKKIGAANDYHPFNLQLTEQRSWLITSYNVHQPVVQALRYVGCTGRMVLSANVSTSSVQPNNKYNPQKASLHVLAPQTALCDYKTTRRRLGGGGKAQNSERCEKMATFCKFK